MSVSPASGDRQARRKSSPGSTLGKFTATALSMRSADIGIPIFAMHSSRELMAVKDQETLNDLVSAFFAEAQ